MIELVPMEELADVENELQIECVGAMPIINGKAVLHCRRFEYIPDKVKVTYADPSDGMREKTEEFDAKDVALSGWPVNSIQKGSA